MNCAEELTSNEANVAVAPMDIESWVHWFSQPLTSISLALAIAAAPITDEERARVLQEAQTECLRAMEQLQALRVTASCSKARAALQDTEVSA